MFGRHRNGGGLHAESTQGLRRDRLHIVQVECALRGQHVAHCPLQHLVVVGGHVSHSCQDERIDCLDGSTCLEVVGP